MNNPTTTYIREQRTPRTLMGVRVLPDFIRIALISISEGVKSNIVPRSSLLGDQMIQRPCTLTVGIRIGLSNSGNV
jgi:hypothetical protein